ncbi:class II aldolase/adducin family protein [Occallatibacter riparius]|uniref:class II aldolase/adducin family protein n=1 Tax=Occallatibacter riparius TaxID=1002689 RepID=UPI0036F3DF1C
MLLATGFDNLDDHASAVEAADAFSTEAIVALHSCIYKERPDVGSIAISSPKGARILAQSGANLPPLFDEQLRHIGPPGVARLEKVELCSQLVKDAFRRGRNAALLGAGLICLGMTCERAVFNAELFEKCAQAFVISRATGVRASIIPRWVQIVATRRLRRDQRKAAASLLNGQIPDQLSAY